MYAFRGAHASSHRQVFSDSSKRNAPDVLPGRTEYDASTVFGHRHVATKGDLQSLCGSGVAPGKRRERRSCLATNVVKKLVVVGIMGRRFGGNPVFISRATVSACSFPISMSF